MKIDPMTRRIFGKENIRQIVREWLEERKIENPYDSIRFREEVLEHNIEWLEQLFMESFRKFVTDTSKFFITTVCYENILNGTEDSLTEEYIALLRKGVSEGFFYHLYEKEYKLDYRFESYLCTKTYEGYFYEGEVYKYMEIRGSKYGTYGMRRDLIGGWVEEELFSLIPQGGGRYLVIPEDWKDSFIKVGETNLF